MMKRTIFSIILILTVMQSNAQDMPEKYLYTKEKLEWVNPWLKTENLSGMLLNRSFLNDTVSSFNDAAISARYDAGALKNIYDPQRNLLGNLSVDSYAKLKNVYLYGNFGFDYKYGIGSRWRGLTNPYKTPFMLADSIAGNTSNEIYSMAAGISVPLGKSFAIGGKMSYAASVFSKHKDLRNKNTVMNFSIVPGFIYNGDRFKAGLNVGYARNTEKAEYIQIDQSAEKYLFELSGIWFFRSMAFSNAETDRMLIESGVFGNLQLEFDYNDLRIINDFGVNYNYGEETETGYNNLRYGDAESLSYSDKLAVFIGNRHKIEAEMLFGRMLGYRYLQQQESDPDSHVRVWVTYGEPINSYIRDYRHLSLNYTYRCAKTRFNIPWEISAGISEMSFSHTHKEYPVYFRQKTDIVEPHIDFTYRLMYGNSSMEVMPGLSFALPLSGIRNDVENKAEISMTSPWQLEEPLNGEFDYFYSSKSGARIRLRYVRFIDRKKGMSIYADAGYGLLYATGRIMNGKARHSVRITFGFRF